jgi:hypothetical protein
VEPHTDKKENKIFLIYKEIQMRLVVKSHMRKDFLIYEEMHKYFHHICMRSEVVIRGLFYFIFYRCMVALQPSLLGTVIFIPSINKGHSVNPDAPNDH